MVNQHARASNLQSVSPGPRRRGRSHPGSPDPHQPRAGPGPSLTTPPLEIKGGVRVRRRADVEVMAREFIAVSTGTPIADVAVQVVAE